MKIFTYTGLKKKAKRELSRLVEAEKTLDDVLAMDCALNAAFTIYHLIEWHSSDQNKKVKARSFAEESENEGIKLLHDVVTRMKHVTVSSRLASEEKNNEDPRAKNNIINIATEEGEQVVTEDGEVIVTEDSYVQILFDGKRALPILEDALRVFLQNELVLV